METRLLGRVSLWRSLRDTWEYRHLAAHLAKSDIDSRFRRSSLGVIWAMLHPLAFTVLYSLVLSTLFKQEFKDYAIYIFSGFVVWNAISAYVNLGALSFLNSAGYLKQSAIPLVIFPTRVCLSVTWIYFIEFASLAFFSLVLIFFFGSSAQVSLYWLWAFPFGLSLVLFGVPLATFSAFLNAYFRDTQQLLLIATQAVWFASPIFFARELFDAPGLSLWSTINPVAAFCDIFRATFIFATAPPTQALLVVGVWIAGLWGLALITLWRSSRRVVMLL